MAIYDHVTKKIVIHCDIHAYISNSKVNLEKDYFDVLTEQRANKDSDQY